VDEISFAEERKWFRKGYFSNWEAGPPYLKANAENIIPIELDSETCKSIFKAKLE